MSGISGCSPCTSQLVLGVKASAAIKAEEKGIEAAASAQAAAIGQPFQVSGAPAMRASAAVQAMLTELSAE